MAVVVAQPLHLTAAHSLAAAVGFAAVAVASAVSFAAAAVAAFATAAVASVAPAAAAFAGVATASSAAAAAASLAAPPQTATAHPPHPWTSRPVYHVTLSHLHPVCSDPAPLAFPAPSGLMQAASAPHHPDHHPVMIGGTELPAHSPLDSPLLEASHPDCRPPRCLRLSLACQMKSASVVPTVLGSCWPHPGLLPPRSAVVARR